MRQKYPLIIDIEDDLSFRCPKCLFWFRGREILIEGYELECPSHQCDESFLKILGALTWWIRIKDVNKYDNFFGMRTIQIIDRIPIFTLARINYEKLIRFPEFVQVGYMEDSEFSFDGKVVICVVDRTNDYIEVSTTKLIEDDFPDEIPIIVFSYEPTISDYYFDYANLVIRSIKTGDYNASIIHAFSFFDAALDWYLERELINQVPLIQSDSIQNILRQPRLRKLEEWILVLNNRLFTLKDGGFPDNKIFKDYVTIRNRIVHPKSYKKYEDKLLEDQAKECFETVVRGLIWILVNDLQDYDKIVQ